MKKMKTKNILSALFMFTIMLTILLVGTASVNAAQQKEEIKLGNFVSYSGQPIMLREVARDRIELRVDGVTTETNLSIIADTNSAGRTKLKAMLKNGQEREIMIMPNVASEIALERLRLRVCSSDNNCTLHLKSVGSGTEEKIQYEFKMKRNSKIFGFFRKEMHVIIDVDAQTGESKIHRPWWSFIAVVNVENN